VKGYATRTEGAVFLRREAPRKEKEGEGDEVGSKKIETEPGE